MARLAMSGFEMNDILTGNFGQPDGVTGGVAASETTIVRSGLRSVKCDSGAGNAVTNVQVAPAGINTAITSAGTITIYNRWCFYFRDLPSSLVGIGGIVTSINGQVDPVNEAPIRLGIDSAGVLKIASGAVPVSTLCTFNESLVTGVWYRLEVSVTFTIIAATSVNVTINEARLNGVALTIASGSLYNRTWTSATPQAVYSVAAGWNNPPGANKVCYVDDVATNDSSGAQQNSWCGEGKIVLLKPTADNAIGTGWTDSGGATTGLWQSVDNTPPTGIADTTSSAGHQIRNASSSSSNYDATLTTYAAAGIGASDTITVIKP